MKIRGDFVTNSSSSCDVMIVIETMDGKCYKGCFDGYERGIMDAGILNNETEFSLRDALKEGTGKDLLAYINDLYLEMFSDHNELGCLFDSESQKAVEELPVSKIRKVRIEEDDSGDYANAKCMAEADTEKQQEWIASCHVVDYGEHYDQYKKYLFEMTRDWKTGEKTVLRNEEKPAECSSDYSGILVDGKDWDE